MWDVANNSAPENIKRAFTRISEVHSYPTRSSINDDFYTEHSRLEKMRSSFLRGGPKIWNSLPSHMRNLPKSTFRKKIRNKLFEILSKSDDYLEITEIMHQLKSFCLRDRGRLGNRGRPIWLKFGTLSYYGDLCNMPKFQLHCSYLG